MTTGEYAGVTFEFIWGKYRTPTVSKADVDMILDSGRIEIMCHWRKDALELDNKDARHLEWTTESEVIDVCKDFVKSDFEEAFFSRRPEGGEKCLFVWGRGATESWCIREREMSAHELAELACRRRA